MVPSQWSLEKAKAHFRNVSERHHAQKKKRVRSMAWTHSGHRLAVGFADGDMKVFKLDRNDYLEEETETGDSHSDAVTCLGFSPSTQHVIASGSADKTVMCYDFKSGRNLFTVNVESDVLGLTWHPAGTSLAVFTKTDKLYLLDGDSGKEINSRTFGSRIQDIEFSPMAGDRMTQLYVTLWSGRLEVLQYSSLTVTFSRMIGAGPVKSISFDPYNRFYVTGSVDSIIGLFEPNDDFCVRTFDSNEHGVRSVGVSHNGNLVAARLRAVDQASGVSKGLIDFFHPASGDLVYTHDPKSPNVGAMAWNPERLVLAYSVDEAEPQDRERPSGRDRFFSHINLLILKHSR